MSIFYSSRKQFINACVELVKSIIVGGEWDSLGHLNLIVALEEEFDIAFEPEDIAKMTSVQIIADKITEYTGK
jgi:acyl carrier protein